MAANSTESAAISFGQFLLRSLRLIRPTRRCIRNKVCYLFRLGQHRHMAALQRKRLRPHPLRRHLLLLRSDRRSFSAITNQLGLAGEFLCPQFRKEEAVRTVPRTINEKRSTLNGNEAQETMPLSSRELLEKELESVLRDVQAIEDEIANDPPDTSGELLRLREIQRTYRGIATNIKKAIALEDSREQQQSNLTKAETAKK